MTGRQSESQTSRQLRYGLYVRKSLEDAERQVYSIETQVRKAREMYPELAIVREYPDEKSAFEPGKRDGFQQVLADIEAGIIDGVVAWHPDRLSRAGGIRPARGSRFLANVSRHALVQADNAPFRKES